MLMVEYNNGHHSYLESKYFYQLYHKYYTEGDVQKLTPEELYILLVLKDNVSLRDKVVNTSYNILGHLLPFTNYKENKKNAAVAKKLMQALRYKNIITYVEPKDMNTPISVSIEKIQYDESDERTRFEQIPNWLVERTNDPYELYILIAVYRFNNIDKSGNFRHPYFRNKKKWGNLLDCDDRTAYKTIEKMIDNGILYWYEADKRYNEDMGKWDQNSGRYFLFKHDEEEKRITERDKKREDWKSSQEQKTKQNHKGLGFNIKNTDEVENLFA
jgi:hypothetical protein